jgi:hypothetical protein
MRAAVLATVVLVGGGCQTAPAPTSPTPYTERAFRTSRVNPADYDLTGYTLEHDPHAEGVSLCRTKLREYCSADGSTCNWEIDLYTVVRPEVCPIDPIE